MVMGGVMLASSPCIPPSISFRMLGTSSARSRNKSWGVPQSSPMTATLGACVIRRLPDRSVVAKRSPAPFAAAPSENPTNEPDGPTKLREWPAMTLLKRVLDQPPVGDDVLLRAMGAMAVVLSLLMVLVAHHIEEIWWWAWAFVILEASTAGLFAMNALLSLPAGAAAWPWWLIGGANAVLGTLELVALARVGMERSPV